MHRLHSTAGSEPLVCQYGHLPPPPTPPSSSTPATTTVQRLPLLPPSSPTQLTHYPLLHCLELVCSSLPSPSLSISLPSSLFPLSSPPPSYHLLASLPPRRWGYIGARHAQSLLPPLPPPSAERRPVASHVDSWASAVRARALPPPALMARLLILLANLLECAAPPITKVRGGGRPACSPSPSSPPPPLQSPSPSPSPCPTAACRSQ